MKSFLDQVVIAKRRQVARLKEEFSEVELESRALSLRTRDFHGAISGGGRIIAEIKRRSPSVKSFLQSGPVDTLARVYAAHGASAISIVSDTPNFGMTLGDVAIVRGSVKLPVLVKDFVIDRIQLLQAAAAGADCILLIARILDRGTLSEFLGTAGDLGMQALVECHDTVDLQKAISVRAPIIGINCRDLGSLSVSLKTTPDLLAGIPQDVIAVAESGIAEAGDIKRLAEAGAGAFLVGTALLAAEDPGRVLDDLLAGATNDVRSDRQDRKLSS